MGPRRHVILTLGRSGSNSLRDMLNQSPEVLNYGEVLGEWNAVRKAQRRLGLFRGDDARYLDWLISGGTFLRAANAARNLGRIRTRRFDQTKARAGIQTIGFKDFSMNFEKYGLRDYLRAREDIQVIGLLREGVADRMVSNAMLGATGVVKLPSADGGGGPRRLRIDPDEIAGLLETIEHENRVLEEMLAELPAARVHVMRYAELFSGDETRQELMDAAFRFLDVAPVQTETRMRKIIRTPIDRTIENFDDCLAAVRGTRFETLLEEAR